MDMASANSSIILVLKTNRNDWLGVVRVVMGFVEMSTFDLGHFHIRALDDIDELDFSEIQYTLIMHLAFLLFAEIFDNLAECGI